MFEFIDKSLVVVTIMLIILSSLYINTLYDKKEDIPGYIKYIILGMISIPFIDASSAMSTAEANKENFIKGNTLICHSKNSEYLVSKKESWNIDADYFKRESLLIRADRCSKR